MMTKSEISLHQSVVQVEGHIVSDMGGEKVMLSVQRGKYYNLGEIGGQIWTLAENPITIHQMVDILMSEYEVEQSVCEAQVLEFLQSLKKEGLVEIQ